jgi:hypothetical protein
MARGWESKSVEEQQDLARSSRADSKKKNLTPEQAEAQRERELLQMSRVQVTAQLAASINPRHREMLEKALADLDKKISASGS